MHIIVVVFFSECIFGRAPFASRSLKEVAEKLKDTKPIEVHTISHISYDEMI